MIFGVRQQPGIQEILPGGKAGERNAGVRPQPPMLYTRAEQPEPYDQVHMVLGAGFNSSEANKVRGGQRLRVLEQVV
ncbi:MAG: hypothetical protein CM15mP74_14580 [Halieaceae bacterium]|nr:MAG: hypothetical protein CM15mP74_14580 [Halieaceae bacterium]